MNPFALSGRDVSASRQPSDGGVAEHHPAALSGLTDAGLEPLKVRRVELVQIELRFAIEGGSGAGS